MIITLQSFQFQHKRFLFQAVVALLSLASLSKSNYLHEFWINGVLFGKPATEACLLAGEKCYEKQLKFIHSLRE
jgi:hypothetical protein